MSGCIIRMGMVASVFGHGMSKSDKITKNPNKQATPPPKKTKQNKTKQKNNSNKKLPSIIYKKDAV